MRLSRCLLAVAAVFVLWTCDKATPVAPSDGTLQISANPVRIDVFGESVITVIGRKAEGGPVNEGTEINLSTTAGQLGASVLIANDRGVAETTLTGSGAVEIATVTASSGGAAPVSVDVQIGALATSITLQATPRRVRSGGDEIRLVAQVRDDEGNPIFRGLVTFETDAGRLASRGAAVETDQQGQAEDRLRVSEPDIERLESPLILVVASVATTGGALLLAEEEISVAGVPFEILLALNPATVDEFGGQVTLTALVADDRGKGVAEQSVLFSSDVGSLASGGRGVSTDGRGEAVDFLTLTANDLGTFNPGDTFEVTARTPRLLEEAADVVRVTGEPEDPASTPTQLFLTTSPNAISEAGGAVNLNALVLAADGQAIEGATVVFISQQVGSLASGGALVLTDSTGVASDILTVTQAELEVFTGSSFDVSAVATAGSGVTDTDTILIDTKPPDVDFDPVNIGGRTFRFDNLSTGRGSLTYSWNFGDPGSTTDTSSAESPTYTYTAAAGGMNVTVSLRVTNSAGSTTLDKPVPVPP